MDTDPDVEIQPALDPFLPKELLAKLEAARAGRAMEGERRVVTMLFCDVKGSTAMAETLDAEDWAGIMNGAFERLIAPVYRYEGTLRSFHFKQGIRMDFEVWSRLATDQ